MVLGAAALAWLHGVCWPSGSRDGKRDGRNTMCWHMWSDADVALCEGCESVSLQATGPWLPSSDCQGFMADCWLFVTAVLTLMPSCMSLCHSCHQKVVPQVFPVVFMRVGVASCLLPVSCTKD